MLVKLFCNSPHHCGVFVFSVASRRVPPSAFRLPRPPPRFSSSHYNTYHTHRKHHLIHTHTQLFFSHNIISYTQLFITHHTFRPTPLIRYTTHLTPLISYTTHLTSRLYSETNELRFVNQSSETYLRKLFSDTNEHRFVNLYSETNETAFVN